MRRNMLKRIGTILLALAVAVTMVPAIPQSGQVSAASVNNPMVTEDETIWDCVYFGSYPQTEIVGNATQCGTYGNSYWGNPSDYEVNSTLYSQLQNARFDSNGDVTIDGIKYRRIKEGDATYRTRGDSLYYNWSDSTTYHYFRHEKIKWRVLNVNRDNAFLLADKALDDQRYNEATVDITWERCTIRSWLNGYDSLYNTERRDYSSKNFMDMAFSSSEQSAIYSTSLENSDNIDYGTEGGNSTTDKIFLLSESDVWNTDIAVSHGFVRASDVKADQRQVKSSTYAKAMGTCVNTSTIYAGNCYWWLRSPGNDSDNAALINYSGLVHRYGSYVDGDDYGIRPALHLNLKSGIWSYAGTVSSNGTEDVADPEAGKHNPQKPAVKEKGNHNGNAAKHVKITLKGTGISGLTKYKMAFKVKWKKQTAKTADSRISGYQIRYSTSSNMKNAKTVTKSGYSSSNMKITGLKSKKKYYVQVRTYMTVNGTKYYSSWSSKKSVTTK